MLTHYQTLSNFFVDICYIIENNQNKNKRKEKLNCKSIVSYHQLVCLFVDSSDEV